MADIYRSNLPSPTYGMWPSSLMMDKLMGD